VICFQIHFVWSAGVVGVPSDKFRLHIKIYKVLTIVCILLTIATAVVTLGVNYSGFDVISYFLTIAIRLFGWSMSFRLATDLVLRSKSKLLFCAAMWSLSQIIGSGLSAAESAENGLVEMLSMGYCLVAICTLAVVSFWLCR